MEVSEIWSSRFTAAKFFYFLNRYGYIAYFCFNCVLDTIQTQNILVRSFYSLSMDSDNSSRRESCTWSITFCSSSCSCKVLNYAQFIINEVADIGVIGRQAHTTEREIAQFLLGIFTFRTFAVYNNNWIVLSTLTILGTARVTIALVKIELYVMFTGFTHGAMCSLGISTKSLMRSRLLRSRNLGLAVPLLLKLPISKSYCWCMCLYVHTSNRRKQPCTRG